jgi:hypothetical protein
MSPGDEAEAVAMGYTVVNGSLGYAVFAPVTNGCTQKKEHIDW